MPVRTRTRGRFTNPTYVYNSYGGVVGSGVSVSNGTRETMYDHTTAKFREKSRNGEVIMKPMTKTFVSRNSTQLSQYYGHQNNPSLWYTFQGDMAFYELQLGTSEPVAPASLHSEQEVLNAQVEASTQCLSQIGRSDADNWENVAEASKTVQMLRHPLDSWFKFNRRAVLVSDALSLSNAWLMYQFGIKPLVKSVEETIKSLQKTNRPVRVTTRARVNLWREQIVNVTWVTGNHSRTYRAQTHETYTVKTMSLDEAINTLSHQAGFGGKSLLTLPWELVPYSFVVDYFLNVGSFIGALANYFQPASLGQCMTTEWRNDEVRTSLSHVTAGPDIIVTPGLSQCTTSYYRYDRVPWLRTPSLVVKSDFRLDDAMRIGNLVALVGQQISSRFLRNVVPKSGAPALF